ncbi:MULTISPECIES: ABC transporter ATP-binding protein [unclassified Ruminococcus]|uniref:ABC transporter ATP-binding protein n=1 Tax=unclassified Ruminococcus TaxID=2608920 RepID=UPI00272E2E1D|nr:MULTISPECIES: ABC transporter ATP-binding protein [unclassified Ruminococcus]MCQ4022913.1 ATP-binding cassette domain-containing protein [Ruminococcus sp. zg-924]MCQ4115271.1 ATP-binding cassette domain-containing protein [Ruminococcus sp. zg-921]
MSLLRLQNVSKIYNQGENRIFALNDVSLKIENGEFTAIVGKSGSGKSTLLNILGCLDTPDSGEYFLSGRSVGRLGENELSRIRNRMIGFVFQSFNLIPSLSACENVELPLKYRGIAKDERKHLALTALDEVGLFERAQHKPNQLSGGQQQRVAIARAIAAQPQLILADEPTGNLDTKSENDVIRILKRLNESGKTVVVITHGKKLAKIANRRITISDGKVSD